MKTSNSPPLCLGRSVLVEGFLYIFSWDPSPNAKLSWVLCSIILKPPHEVVLLFLPFQRQLIHSKAKSRIYGFVLGFWRLRASLSCCPDSLRQTQVYSRLWDRRLVLLPSFQYLSVPQSNWIVDGGILFSIEEFQIINSGEWNNDKIIILQPWMQ